MFSPRITTDSIGRSTEKKHQGKSSHEFEYSITFDTLREWTMHGAVGTALTWCWSLKAYLSEYEKDMRTGNSLKDRNSKDNNLDLNDKAPVIKL